MFDSPGLRYHCSYQLESLPAEVFLQVHREMEVDARKAILKASLPGSSISSPDCLSYLMSDLLPEGLVIHSFHTYPDNGDNLFENPDTVRSPVGRSVLRSTCA